MYALLIGIAAAISIALLSPTLLDGAAIPPLEIAVLAVLWLIMYATLRMRVRAEVTDDELRVKLTPFGAVTRTRVKLSDIKSVQRIHRAATLTTGYGYRLTPRGMLYITGTGDGVRIERYGKKKGLEIVIGPGAEELARTLEDKMVAPELVLGELEEAHEAVPLRSQRR